MKKVSILLIMMLVLTVLGLSGCNEITETGGTISETLNPPDYVIMSKESREGYEGPDRVGYVDVTVQNNGGSGKGTVYVRVDQGSNQWTKSKPINIGNGQSITLSFHFNEIQFWTFESWSYSTWVE